MKLGKNSVCRERTISSHPSDGSKVVVRRWLPGDPTHLHFGPRLSDTGVTGAPDQPPPLWSTPRHLAPAGDLLRSLMTETPNVRIGRWTGRTDIAGGAAGRIEFQLIWLA